jgi:hypothetical protein
MLEELEAASSKPDHTCQQILNRWRDLLAATPSGKPSLEVLIGLFCELWYLREIIRLKPASLACWTEPARTRHDFVKNNLALEVKTSRSRQGRFVEIHRHTQLEAPVGGEFYLATLKLEETTGTDESLTSLVVWYASVKPDCRIAQLEVC